MTKLVQTPSFPDYSMSSGRLFSDSSIQLSPDPLQLSQLYQQQAANSLLGDINLADRTRLTYGINTPSAVPSPASPPNTGIKWFGKDGVVIPGLNAFANITNAYTGLQQLGLAKDAFEFNKQSYLRDLANRSQAYNTALEDRTRTRLSQEGARVPGLDRLVTSQTENRRVKGTL